MKEYEPTDKDRRSVETMASFGIPKRDIARALRMRESTLKEHFEEELANAATRANANVAHSLYNQATGEKPNVTAAIFWLKCRAGWREKDSEVTVNHAGTVDLTAYSDDDLRTLKRILKPRIIDVEASDVGAGRSGTLAKR